MNVYHVLNRGVDKRNIFLDDQDRARFVHDLYEFNDTHPTNNNYTRTIPMRDIVSPSLSNTREKIVDIHGWVLMDNHYHLLLSERVEGGLSLFIRKLNVGYAKYFNERYDRSGTLFQGRTKKILIEHDAHFLYILHYVHLNPLDRHEETAAWRSQRIPDIPQTLSQLADYRWSSYLDYAGVKNFPSILTTTLFNESLGGATRALTRYLEAMDHTHIQALTLE